LEQILGHITLDRSPITIYQGRESGDRPRHAIGEADDWEVDPSGYDGWLSVRLRAPGD